MKNLTYVSGDLFAAINGDLFPAIKKQEGSTIFLPHVCNNVGAWGAGFVIPLGKTFPQARDAYLDWRKGTQPPATAFFPIGQELFVMGNTQMVEIPGNPKVIVCNMVAQELGGERPLHYNHLAACMETVAKQIVGGHPHAEICCPLFGAALAGGNWEFIEQLVFDCWLRRKIKTTVFYLPSTLDAYVLNLINTRLKEQAVES